MNRLGLTLFWLAVVACSDGRRQEAAVDTREQADLTLPDTHSAKDSSFVLASRAEPPVSPVEQEAAQPEPARQATPARRPPRKTPVAPPARAAADDSVQGYAASSAIDSSRASDSALPVADTAPDQPRTGRDTVIDLPATPGTAGDTVPPATNDTSPVSPPAPPADTAPAVPPDTTSTAAGDTMVARPSTAAAPVGRPADAPARIIAAGTEIHAALNDSITSRRDTVGHTVAGHVMENVTGPDGRTLIAAGTPVRFTITRLRASRSKNSQGRLVLRADGIALNGQLRPIEAQVRPVPRELRGRGVTGSEVAKVGGGAAAGAVLGGVIGDEKGAVIGGVAGAAAGAVVASQTATRDVVVKAKTPIVLVLTAPLLTP